MFFNGLSKCAGEWLTMHNISNHIAIIEERIYLWNLFECWLASTNVSFQWWIPSKTFFSYFLVTKGQCPNPHGKGVKFMLACSLQRLQSRNHSSMAGKHGRGESSGELLGVWWKERERWRRRTEREPAGPQPLWLLLNQALAPSSSFSCSHSSGLTSCRLSHPMIQSLPESSLNEHRRLLGTGRKPYQTHLVLPF